jgi:hypothetical protein
MNAPCELCENQSTHEYYFGAELLHRYCAKHDREAAAATEAVYRMALKRHVRARHQTAAFVHVHVPAEDAES